MKRIRSKDTKGEVAFRKLLYHHGLRYRKNWKELPGKPDIVITKYHICIFIDGEYFHGKDWENGEKERVERGNNASYWVPKIERNIERDRQIEADLTGMGWVVLRFWSRDVLKNPDKCFAAVQEVVFEKQIEEK
jgi:DNA mismatch endonuclease (patch repair protein)